MGRLSEETIPGIQTLTADCEQKLEKLQSVVADTYTALLSHAGRGQPSKIEWVTERTMCCSFTEIRYMDRFCGNVNVQPSTLLCTLLLTVINVLPSTLLCTLLLATVHLNI